MSNWDKVIKPIVVLSVICIVITGALAVTNSATAPVIAEAIRQAQEAARKELLPEAEGFEKVEGVSVENVSDIQVATNGVGVVVTSAAKGYGGTMTVMTAFDADGNIKQIKVTEDAETQGIGSKVSKGASYWENYAGKSGAQALVLDQDVDRLGGATISSRALNAAVNSAIEAYNQIP